MFKMFCPSCTPSCYLILQHSTLVHLRKYVLYVEKSLQKQARSSFSLSLSLYVSLSLITSFFLSVFKQIDNADLTFVDIRMSTYLLNHCSVFQSLDDSLNEPLYSTIDRKHIFQLMVTDILTLHQLQTVISYLPCCHFQTNFLLKHSLPSLFTATYRQRAFQPSLPLYLIPWTNFKTQTRPLPGRLPHVQPIALTQQSTIVVYVTVQCPGFCLLAI